MTTTPLPIIVGIDGTIRSVEATRWAAHEAARRRTSLQIVHAGYLSYLVPLPGDRAVTDGALVEAYEAAVQAEAFLDVKTVEPAAQPARYLLDHSQQAAMIVVGTHAGNSLSSSLLGSIAQTVAAHAQCPVAVVGQPEPTQYAAAGPVVVGISNHPGGVEALQFAFEEAASTGADLVAVRSWGNVDWGPGRLGYNTELFAQWRRMESVLLDAALADVESRYPRVKVHRMLEGERPDHALQRIAKNGRLLVVGAHRRDDHWFSRLGPVPSWLLHRSPCPLVIVGQPHALPPDTVESSSQLAEREPVHVG